jgi:hypothetical protein
MPGTEMTWRELIVIRSNREAPVAILGTLLAHLPGY